MLFNILCIWVFCLLICGYTTSEQSRWRPEVGIRSSRDRINLAGVPLCGCWELKPGTLEEQSVLLTLPNQDFIFMLYYFYINFIILNLTIWLKNLLWIFFMWARHSLCSKKIAENIDLRWPSFSLPQQSLLSCYDKL